MYSNAAYFGGGLALLNIHDGHIERSEIYANTAFTSSGGGISNGGTYPNYDSQLTLLDNSLHHNHAEGNGGAIENNDASLVISRTVLDANTAGAYGGGMMINQTYNPATVLLDQSTLSRNTAQYGGGVYYDGFAFAAARSSLILLNSTLNGNSASHDGGGIYGIRDAGMFLFNATIAGNAARKQLGQLFPIRGGGVFITTTAIITAQNALIGDNIHAVGFLQPVPDDCFTAATTSLHSLGYNLVETTTNCTISGTTFGNVTGQDPKLGLLQNNGGSTPTQALLPGSLAIEAGDMAGCKDENGAAITTDQRGFRRPIGARCDIGAFEYSPFALRLPLIRR